MIGSRMPVPGRVPCISMHCLVVAAGSRISFSQQISAAGVIAVRWREQAKVLIENISGIRAF